MGKENKTYRIRTNVDHDSVVSFSVDNTVDTFEILSLDINQTNAYRLMNSDTGIIAGRVLANGGFGVPNAKLSVFIPYEDTASIEKRVLYHYATSKDYDDGGVRYNLLPKELDDECHQNIGTFVGKRVLLDDNNWIDVFDKYYSLTTRTNDSGDYLIYGVPTGMQTVHMDIDLSDIGILSQRPSDLIYKGYNANMFESPNKFKVDTNIDSLAQVITQEKTIYVYPFWGDTTDNELNASITRCDINVNYKFEPTCIFMGSVITDTGENAMSKKCIGAKMQGKMSEMITGEGRIEMIRKTPNGQIEQFSIKGDSNINSDGVWCYQIPMNLDYVKTDEFGKMVMSDNPATGLPTRARVRFRLSMADAPSDATARKRARFLIPNNPRLVEEDYPEFCETKEIDYEFGTKTKDENFRDLMWNNVYTVKSYIPRIQKSKLPNNLRHLGIKMVNHSGSNNPMPFNNLRIKFNFVYMFLCTLVKVLVTIVGAINTVLTWIGYMFYTVGEFCFNISEDLPFTVLDKEFLGGVAKLFGKYNKESIHKRYKEGLRVGGFLRQVYKDYTDKTNVTGGLASLFMKIFVMIGCGVKLEGLCETDDGVEIVVTPGTNDKAKQKVQEAGMPLCNDRVDELFNCVENQLAQENEVTSFNFYNDWINGVVYLPLWYRKIRVRRKGKPAKDKWCRTDNSMVHVRSLKTNVRIYATNVPQRKINNPTSTTMGTIKPLAENSNTVTAFANNETGAEVLAFTKYNDDNCYGYQCHKYARTFFKIYKGLIYEKATMLGDKVYYYKPCMYDTSTGNKDLVTLFATDIVLLGSLNNCDIHGVPQFFKCLESTTYNMPPDLLTETYDYKNEDNMNTEDNEDANEIDLATRMTEYTGADWGNLGADQSNLRNELLSFNGTSWYADANENEYDNGGLFYGLTCFDSYTKPKTCINLSRICEIGVSLDESTEIPVDSGDGSDIDGDTDTLTPDGFVSYDDVYNPDYRSMFATLNSNWLKTRINTETGLPEYDFNHLYIDNFDGSMRNLMMARTVKGTTEKSDFTEQANYVNNYKLELSSDAYLNFRYGDYLKKNNKKIYFYENNNTVGKTHKVSITGKDRLPRYENSFYFYFGLNEGKTAIDKFNSEFFAPCGNNVANEVPYELAYQGNSWCPTDARDGFVAFNLNIETPVSVIFTNQDTGNVYSASNIKDAKFLLGTNPGTTEYSKYIHYDLYETPNTDNNQNSSSNNVPVTIMPTGTYSVKLIDNYENEYDDSLVFELPRIGFVCDVNPFNCKNNDLVERFGQNVNRDIMFEHIANYGVADEYKPYKILDEIPGGATYYTRELVPGTGETYRYIKWENLNKRPIQVMEPDTYYYLAVGEGIDRDIYGYISVSDISEKDFRLKLTPVNDRFFGNDYTGVTIDVHVNNAGVPTVTDNGDGYLGYINNEGLITYYIGVPFGNQRYKLEVTQLCGSEPSNNTVELVVVVYEDNFKLYINDIDYDLISNFKTGWDDATLNTTSGIFNSVSGTSVFTANTVVGWNDVFNIGKYVYNGTKDVSLVNYDININELNAVCGVMESGYGGNGTVTPYTWVNECCYDAPLDIVNTNYNKGTAQKVTLSYTINGEYAKLFDGSGNAVYASDIQSGETYYVDQEHQNLAVLGVDYFENDDIYTISEEYASLYDSNNNVIYASGIQSGVTYYVDQEHETVAVQGEDYFESIDYIEISVTRNDTFVEYVVIRDAEMVYNNDVYYLYQNGQYVKYVVSGIALQGSTVEQFKQDHGLTGVTMYYKLEDPEFSATYIADVNTVIGIGVNTVVGTEDGDGAITYENEDLYNNLDCIRYFDYRSVIDELNDHIQNRIDLSRSVAGAFRVGANETTLTLRAKTKAYPVRYLIAGNKEMPTANLLYNYVPKLVAITPTTAILPISGKLSIENDYERDMEYLNRVGNGCVFDPYFETMTVNFELPTLVSKYIGSQSETLGTISVVNGTIGNLHGGVIDTDINDIVVNDIIDNDNSNIPVSTVYKYSEYIDKADAPKHPYYIAVANDNNSIIPTAPDLNNFDVNTENKNLTTMFGVHFYDKPLTGTFPVILSYICDIPVYPTFRLGGVDYSGKVYEITQHNTVTGYYDYFICEESLNGTTGVKSYYQAGTNDIVANNVNGIITYANGYSHLSNEREITLTINTVVGNNTVIGTYYLKDDYANYRIAKKTEDDIEIYSCDDFPTLLGVGTILYEASGTQYNGLEPITESNLTFGKYIFTEYTSDHYGQVSPGWNQDNVYYKNSETQYLKYPRTSVPATYNDNVMWTTYGDNKLIDKDTSFYYIDSRTNPYTFVFVENGYYQLFIDEGWYTSDNIPAKLMVRILRDIIKTRLGLTSTAIAKKNPLYMRNSSTIGQRYYHKDFTFPRTGDDTMKMTFHGTIYDNRELIESWNPINVSMPGFATGCLYNGNPIDDDKSNIVADLNGNEISLYTVDEDIYENTEVRRVMYTQYASDEYPLYGEYNAILSVNNTLGIKYEYIEVPFTENELTYTDGYGDSYQTIIDGTFGITCNEPLFVYRNRHEFDGNTGHDDYLDLRTTSTEYQAVYYIFDCDKTDYPLYYADTESLQSNLRYDYSKQVYYFNKMPEIFTNLYKSGYISKSKSTSFNISRYLRDKYEYGQEANTVCGVNLYINNDRFFAIAALNGCFAISPIFETQIPRSVRNYTIKRMYRDDEIIVAHTNYCVLNATDGTYSTRELQSDYNMYVKQIKEDTGYKAIYETADSHFDNSGKYYIYITVLYGRDKELWNNIHYVEDLYYLLYYRFYSHFKTYDKDTDRMSESLYTQTCSIQEGTAEKAYIKVNDGSDEGGEYWATAIKFEVSALGTELPDWYHCYIEDKTGITRYAIPNSNVTVTEFGDEEDMIENYNSTHSNS